MLICYVNDIQVSNLYVVRTEASFTELKCDNLCAVIFSLRTGSTHPDTRKDKNDVIVHEGRSTDHAKQRKNERRMNGIS